MTVFKFCVNIVKTITADRFYHSGDVGVMDADGNLRIVGRIKELIIRGGANIYPAEVEQVLFSGFPIVLFYSTWLVSTSCIQVNARMHVDISKLY